MKNDEETIHAENERVLELVSRFLNLIPNGIDREMLASVSVSEDTEQYSYSALMAALCGLDPFRVRDDDALFRNYFIPMIRKQNGDDYRENAYYKNVTVPEAVCGRWQLCNKKYAPYEAFVYDDMVIRDNGRLLPRIGYFSEEFSFPCVCEGGREWMTVTPNEINTMEHPISTAHGNVLTFGLGLGYYVYMVAEKDNVATVTAVERDRDVIKLFSDVILPQIPNRNKIKLICADAFEFADAHLAQGGYDHVFTDIWHDVSDGLDLYKRMKQREQLCPGAVYEYWIEKTIRCYMPKADVLA